MSKNFKQSAYDPKRGRNQDFNPPGQQYPQIVPSRTQRYPLLPAPTGHQNPLNYSIQTGEEFSMEFMQERVNPNTNMMYIQSIPEEKGTTGSYKEEREIQALTLRDRTASTIPKHRMEERTESRDTRRNDYAESEHRDSMDQQSRHIHQISSVNYDLSQATVKFLCCFGGQFLLRPSDGRRRYVGGHKYLIRVRKDISWQELTQKLIKLYKHTHTIKYRLPGETSNLLISVLCDEDVHFMIEECSFIRGSDAKPRVFLFPSEVDEHVHSHSGNGADQEAQFIESINEALLDFAAHESDQVLYEVDEVAQQEYQFALRNEEALMTEVNFEDDMMGARRGKSAVFYKQRKKQTKQDSGDVDDEDFALKSHSKIYLASKMQSRLTHGKHTQKGHTSMKPTNNAWRFNRGVTDEQLQEARRTRYMAAMRKEHIVTGPKYDDGTGGAIYRNPNLGLTDTSSNTREPPKRRQNPADSIRLQKNADVQHINAETRRQGRQLTVYQDFMKRELRKNQERQKPLFEDSRTATLAQGPSGAVRSSTAVRRHPSEENEQVPLAEDRAAKSKDGGNGKRNYELQHMIEVPGSSKQLTTSMLWCDDMVINLHSHDNQSSVKRYSGEGNPEKNSLGRNMLHGEHDPQPKPSMPTKMVLSPRHFDSSENKSSQPYHNAPSSGSRRQSQEEGGNTNQATESPRQSYGLSKLAKSHSYGKDSNDLPTKVPSQEGEEKPTIIDEVVLHSNDGQESPLSETGLEINYGASNLQIIKNEDLEDLRELGSGAFGTVFHGKWRGTDVAIKRIKTSYFTTTSQSDKKVVEFLREAAFLSQLHHPNVLAFYGVVRDGPGGTLATVTEFMVSGSLKKVLLRKDRYLDWRKRLMLAVDAAMGMEYVHSKNIIHFDLKCDNLLVNLKDPSRPICKVADLGLSKMKHNTLVSGGMRGTLPWMAPECLAQDVRVSEKIDVYSFGIVMWEILTSEEPYSTLHYGAVLEITQLDCDYHLPNVKAAGIVNNTLRPPIPSSCDPDWRNLMEQCWDSIPERRPAFTEVATRLRSILEASQARQQSQ